jgi:hypothetical protein
MRAKTAALKARRMILQRAVPKIDGSSLIKAPIKRRVRSNRLGLAYPYLYVMIGIYTKSSSRALRQRRRTLLADHAKAKP